MTGAPVDPVVLWGRAVVLAVVAVFLGAAGHVTADGLLPGAGWLALLVALGSVVSVASLARPASTVRIVTTLVVGQAAVHAVLSGVGGHVGDGDHGGGAAATPASGALPLVEGRRVGSLQDAYDVVPHGVPALPVSHLAEHLSSHAPMMLAHALAAVLVGLWLAVGERALWTLLALASATLLRPVLLLLLGGSAVVPAGAPAVRPSGAPRPRVPALLARTVVRRGPPLLAA